MFLHMYESECIFGICQLQIQSQLLKIQSKKMPQCNNHNIRVNNYYRDLMPKLAPLRTYNSSLVSASWWLQGSMFNFSKEELDTILPPIVATMVTNVSGIWITASAIILNSFVLLVSFLLNFWKSLQFGVSLRKDILIPAPLFSPVWLFRLFSL